MNAFLVSLLMSAVLPILASPTTTTEHSILAMAAAIGSENWIVVAIGAARPLFLPLLQRRDSNLSRHRAAAAAAADLLTVEFLQLLFHLFLLSGR